MPLLSSTHWTQPIQRATATWEHIRNIWWLFKREESMSGQKVVRFGARYIFNKKKSQLAKMLDRHSIVSYSSKPSFHHFLFWHYFDYYNTAGDSVKSNWEKQKWRIERVKWKCEAETETGDSSREKQCISRQRRGKRQCQCERKRERDKERCLWLSGRPKQTLGAMSPKGLFQPDWH